MKIIFFLVLAVVFMNHTSALRKFINGKYFSKIKTTGLTDIPDQYYEQRLDHYNEALLKTWKQVSCQY